MTVSTRLPAPKPSTGRQVLCHYCTAPFSTAKPHDPERDPGEGTCEDCRLFAAEEWAEANKTTINAAITRFTRYA